MNTSVSVVKQNKLFWTAVVIIVLAGVFLRFWNLGNYELTFDEGIYGFRSMGYLDYMENPDQVTPIQRFLDTPAPAWLSLSFHDAPPLFFFIEHIFFALFGQSLLISRLPSTLAGLGSVVLVFFITRLLFSKLHDEKLRAWKDWAGLLAAGIMTLSFSSIAVARLNQLESVLFFFILVNVWCFLKFADDKKWWWAFGVSFGLCLLTKYTAVFLVPAYFLYLFAIHSPLLKNWRWYAGWGIAGLLFLPVIIYNIKLYGLLGHFDLQFAYLFGQATPEWRGIGGKSQEPFTHLADNLLLIYSVPFLLLTLAGLGYAAFRRKLGEGRLFTILMFIFAFALLGAVGSAVRFISLLIIPAAVLIALAFTAAGTHGRRKAAVAFAVLFLVYEAYFSAHLLFFNTPDYGLVKLDNYFQSILGDARPAGLPTHPNQNLNTVIRSYASERQATLPTLGLVYDDRIATPARLWLFSRRQYYQGIPVMPASQFLQTLETTGPEAFKDFQIYLVKAGPATTVSEVKNQKYLATLTQFFAELPAESTFTISGHGGVAFEIARFIL